jgi:hypothetical protein
MILKQEHYYAVRIVHTLLLTSCSSSITCGLNLRASVWPSPHHKSSFLSNESQKHLKRMRLNKEIHSPSSQLIFIHKSCSKAAVYMIRKIELRWLCLGTDSRGSCER